MLIIRTALKTARLNHDYELSQVAEKLEMCPKAYQSIEAGRRGTTSENWLKIYYLFNCTVPLHELMKNKFHQKDTNTENDN